MAYKKLNNGLSLSGLLMAGVMFGDMGCKGCGEDKPAPVDRSVESDEERLMREKREAEERALGLANEADRANQKQDEKGKEWSIHLEKNKLSFVRDAFRTILENEKTFQIIQSADLLKKDDASIQALLHNDSEKSMAFFKEFRAGMGFVRGLEDRDVLDKSADQDSFYGFSKLASGGADFKMIFDEKNLKKSDLKIATLKALNRYIQACNKLAECVGILSDSFDPDCLNKARDKFEEFKKDSLQYDVLNKKCNTLGTPFAFDVSFYKESDDKSRLAHSYDFVKMFHNNASSFGGAFKKMDKRHIIVSCYNEDLLVDDASFLSPFLSDSTHKFDNVGRGHKLQKTKKYLQNVEAFPLMHGGGAAAKPLFKYATSLATADAEAFDATKGHLFSGVNLLEAPASVGTAFQPKDKTQLEGDLYKADDLKGSKFCIRNEISMWQLFVNLFGSKLDDIRGDDLFSFGVEKGEAKNFRLNKDKFNEIMKFSGMENESKSKNMVEFIANRIKNNPQLQKIFLFYKETDLAPFVTAFSSFEGATGGTSMKSDSVVAFNDDDMKAFVKLLKDHLQAPGQTAVQRYVLTEIIGWICSVNGGGGTVDKIVFDGTKMGKIETANGMTGKTFHEGVNKVIEEAKNDFILVENAGSYAPTKFTDKLIEDFTKLRSVVNAYNNAHEVTYASLDKANPDSIIPNGFSANAAYSRLCAYVGWFEDILAVRDLLVGLELGKNNANFRSLLGGKLQFANLKELNDCYAKFSSAAPADKGGK